MTQVFLPLHKIFEIQAKHKPNNIAIIHGQPSIQGQEIIFRDEYYKYDNLNKLANQVARLFEANNVKKGDIVSLALERGVYVFACMLACSKIGAAFLLIDTHYPQERIEYILSDAKPVLTIYEDNLADIINLHELTNYLLLSDLKSNSADYSIDNLNYDIKASDIAYLIYTSGTTGKPKGALVPHQGLHNWINVQKEIFNLNQNDRIFQFAPLSFDPSIWDAIMAFGVGASLYLTSREVCVDADALNKIFKEKQITGVTVTPIVLSWLKPDIDWKLRFLVSTGEAFKSQYALTYLDKHIDLYNGYGPSETTIGISLHKVTREDVATGIIPIGNPIKNTKVYLLDDVGNIVSDSQAGEICVAGLLAAGYLRNPELTSEKFIENPDKQARTLYPKLYKTGDIGRFENGLLTFLGRKDRQIKIHGKRIELDEIQRIILQHESLQDIYVSSFVTAHP